MRGLGGLYAVMSPEDQQEVADVWCGDEAIWKLDYLPTQDLLQVANEVQV
jgi:hypothetical protein